MFFFDVKLHSLQNQAFLECCTGQDYRCLNTRASKHLVLVLGGDWGWKNNSENRIYFVWKNLGKSPQKFSFYAMHKVGLSWNLHFREGGEGNWEPSWEVGHEKAVRKMGLASGTRHDASVLVHRRDRVAWKMEEFTKNSI